MIGRSRGTARSKGRKFFHHVDRGEKLRTAIAKFGRW
jgi:hypothetical protein